MSSPSESAAAADAGVIHDLGYRPYGGPRLGEGPVAWAFFMTGLRNTYGLGRSGRSKVLPMILLAMMLLPALILVGVLVQAKDLLDLDEQIVAYSTYPITTQLLISVFVAAQAPALISRDLRFRTITLYLARPMRRSVYVLVRLASLSRGDVRPDRRAAAADVRRRAARRPAGRPRDHPLPRRRRRRGAAGRVPVRAGGAGRGADHPPRAGGRRGDRRAARQLHRGRDHPGHRPRHRPRPGSARSPACSRRTRWSTGCRSSSSTPPRRRPRRRPAPAWACSTSSRCSSWCSARSPACWPATGRSSREQPSGSTTSRAGTATSSRSTTSR